MEQLELSDKSPLLILGVNEYMCLGEEERGKRSTVIPSLHQL